MSSTFIVIWFGVNIGVFLLLSLIQIPLRNKRLIPLRIILIVVKAVLALAVAYKVMVGEELIFYKIDFYLASVYVALVGDLVGDIVTLPIVIARKRKNSTPIQIVVSFLCFGAFLMYGTVNMQMAQGNPMTFKSSKLKQEHRVVFVSDLHVGTAQDMNTTENTIVKLAAASPEFIVLGGDIVDELTTKEEMEKTFELFGSLKIPVYFVYGNHDRQPTFAATGENTFTPEELESAIEKNGIKILKDEWINISDDLVLFGREDISRSERKALADIPARPSDAFVLLIDHSPYQKEDITNSGADLQLSGHSHAGQLFPLKTLYGLAGYDAYGNYHYGNTDLYVSSGAAGWGFPFRTEEACHYEIVTLSPQ